MPRALADKAKFFADIQAFLQKRGSTGAKLHEVYEHMQTVGWVNLQLHQVKHALEVMLNLNYPISRWKGDGRGHTWVNKVAQEEQNKKVVEPPAPTTVQLTPDIIMDLVKDTGRVRIKLDRFIIEIGVV